MRRTKKGAKVRVMLSIFQSRKVSSISFRNREGGGWESRRPRSFPQPPSGEGDEDVLQGGLPERDVFRLQAAVWRL